MPTERVKSEEHSGRLSNRQRVFCELAATGITLAEAYIQAGFRPKDKNAASVQASGLKLRPHIRAYFDECRRRHAAQADLTAQRVMEELRAVACSDIEDYSFDAAGRMIVRDGAHPLASRAVASKRHTVKRRIAVGAEGDATTVGMEITETEIKLWNKVEGLKLASEIVGLTDRDQQNVGVVIDQIIINLPPDTGEKDSPLVIDGGAIVSKSVGGNE